jgi:hypothetical protein
MALRLRRGTEAERLLITPQQGEIIYVTDTKKIYSGDGATIGGVLVGPTLLEQSSPQLGGDLNLNGNNITGTGNINITGNITATGNINLGDNSADNISVLGLINSTLTPAIDDSYNLGTSAKQWANIWATQANIDTTLAVGSQIIKLSGGSGDSSLVLWDAETDTVSVSVVIANTFEGNLVGSVFGDDSTTLVDGVNNTLSTGALTIEANSITSASFIEFDFESSAVFNGKNLKIVSTDADPDVPDAPGIIFETSRGTTASPLTIQLGDKIATYTGNAWTGSEYSTLGGISIGASVGTLGTEALPGAISMFVLGDNGGFNTFAQLDSSGVFTSLALQSFGLTTAEKTAIINKFGGVGVAEEIVKGMIVYDTTLNKLTTFHPTEGWGDIQTSTAPHQLPVYANDAARSAAITTPSAGMVVFMTSGTAPTVTNKPVIYNGTSWEAF